MLKGPSTNGAIPLEALVMASSKQISCQLDNEAVVLNLEDGIYYSLNPVASRVWELVQESRTVRDIRDSLLSEYDIEESTCTKDLLDLLEQLHQWKLIEVHDGHGTSPH